MSDPLARLRADLPRDATADDRRAHLDATLGPTNWTIHYRDTDHGCIALLDLRVGDEWVGKEGGVTRPRAIDTGSIYDAAFVAATLAWRIGQAAPNPVPTVPSPTPTPPIKTYEPPPAADANLFDPPGPGTGTARWVAQISAHFGVSLWERINQFADQQQIPLASAEWNTQQHAAIVTMLIKFLSGLNHYKGEFAHLIEQAAQAPKAEKKKADEHRKVKVEIRDTVEMLLFATSGGKKPTDAEVFAEIQTFSGSVHEHGDMIPSLSGCRDGAWLTEILEAAQQALKGHAASSPAVAAKAEAAPFS